MATHPPVAASLTGLSMVSMEIHLTRSLVARASGSTSDTVEAVMGNL